MRLDVLSVIIATLALLKPYLEQLYQVHFKKGKIEFFPTGRLELGFSTFGPTLGLYGTLRATGLDAFVTKVSCNAIRKRDRSEREFEWIAVRTFQILPSENLKLELPSSFNVSKSQPYRIALTLASLANQEEIQPITESIFFAYSSYFRENFDEILEVAGTEGVSDFEVVQRLGYDWFASTEACYQHLSNLQRKLLWTPGDYQLLVSVHRSDKEEPDITTVSFKVEANDELLLLGNASVISRIACNQPNNEYQFAHVKYVNE